MIDPPDDWDELEEHRPECAPEAGCSRRECRGLTLEELAMRRARRWLEEHVGPVTEGVVESLAREFAIAELSGQVTQVTRRATDAAALFGSAIRIGGYIVSLWEA